MKLSDLKELEAKASPAPWKWDCGQLCSPDDVVMNQPGINRPGDLDAIFICLMRNHIKQLIEVAEAFGLLEMRGEE